MFSVPRQRNCSRVLRELLKTEKGSGESWRLPSCLTTSWAALPGALVYLKCKIKKLRGFQQLWLLRLWCERARFFHRVTAGFTAGFKRRLLKQQKPTEWRRRRKRKTPPVSSLFRVCAQNTARASNQYSVLVYHESQQILHICEYYATLYIILAFSSGLQHFLEETPSSAPPEFGSIYLNSWEYFFVIQMCNYWLWSTEQIQPHRIMWLGINNAE